MALFGLLCATAATAGTLKTVHDFKSATGFQSQATPILANGLIYGSTSRGGTANEGALYVFNPATNAFKVLYNFQGGVGGQAPIGALTYQGGLLYGATAQGGTVSCGGQEAGTIFAVDASTGAQSVIYTFQAGEDGGSPSGGMVISGGILYGTTYYGGPGASCANPGYGTIFAIDLTTYVKTTLYDFQGGTDGSNPAAGLALADGVLYGTTSLCETASGQPCAGTVFSYTIASGVETPVHQFNCCSDGESPLAPVIAQAGMLYGTTHDGGTHEAGIIFSFNTTTGEYTILHNFGGAGDAAGPWFGNLVYSSGVLYGTTQYGGASDDGAIFALDLATRKTKVGHSFKNNALGDNPRGGLVLDGAVFYGTTWQPYGGLFSYVP